MDASSYSAANGSSDDASPGPAPAFPTAAAPGASVTPDDGGKGRFFAIGPDFLGVRQGRPYFLVPLDRKNAQDTSEQNTTRERIVSHLQGKPVTDIFIFSHGWHRNFYGAVAAYDKIAARNAQLLHRKRFETIRKGPPFNPLFLMLHWHSDPGENAWVDHAGRRSKTGFLESCEQRFVRPNDASWPAAERFTTVFEDLFDLFSKMSAPDSEALDEADNDKSKRLATVLARPEFVLRDAPGATATDKIAAAWAAYHTAPVRQFVVNQKYRPGYFIRPDRAFLNLAKFLALIIPLTLLLGVVLRVWQYIPGMRRGVDWLAGFVQKTFRDCVNVTMQVLPLDGEPARVFTAVSWLLALSGMAALLLGALVVFSHPDERPKEGVKWPRVALWLLIAVPLALPLLLFLFATYLFAPIGPWAIKLLRGIGDGRLPRPRGLFDERFGSRGESIPDADVQQFLRPTPVGTDETIQVSRRFVRYHLAQLARSSVRLLRAGLDKENPGHSLVNGVDNQLAFWEMQVQGVAAGREAAHFYGDLHEQLAAQGLLDADVRIHLLGHSFGGLVICNMARHLRHDPRCRRDNQLKVPSLNTICLLNAAIAGTWFEDEEEVVSYIKDGIGCVYSYWDTANSFYYPVANNGRLSAGWVGLHNVGGQPPTKPVRTVFTLPPSNYPAMFASLVMPPDLERCIPKPPAPAAVATHTVNPSLVVNLDGSRLMFQGAPATGGGHGDIFKDDVSHLCWAVTRIGLETEPEGRRNVTAQSAPASVPARNPLEESSLARAGVDGVSAGGT